MTLSRIVPAFALFVLTAMTVQAQVKLGMSSERNNYLLYEPAPFAVQVTNESEDPLDFTSDEASKRSWLSFIILRMDGSKVRAEATFAPKDRFLKPGESMTVTVNITPYYALRETGEYTIQAVVHPDTLSSFITSKLTFNISKGETIWQRDKMLDGKRTTYSLIQFLEDATSCYVRVEEPEENLVLSTTRTGSLLANSLPTVLFDENGEMHMLQSLAARTYRYTRLSEEGKIVYQEDRKASSSIPILVAQPNGSVEFLGGIGEKDMLRPNLSDVQGGKVVGSAEHPLTAPAGAVPPGPQPAAMPPLPRK